MYPNLFKTSFWSNCHTPLLNVKRVIRLVEARRVALGSPSYVRDRQIVLAHFKILLKRVAHACAASSQSWNEPLVA